MTSSLALRVNGDEVARDVEPRTHLADFLRESLDLTGTHIGCEHGVCGACTLMIDGRPARSCITLAVSCQGADIRTVEGFECDPVMAAIRAAFKSRHALQCGYCTPGMLATAYDIVTRLPNADERRIREELSGNLCRCTGYAGIVAAIQQVLASGPHRSELRTEPRRPPATVAATPIAPMPAAGASAFPEAIPDAIKGGTDLTRSLEIAVPLERGWAMLQDIALVARCLPGALIETIGNDGMVTGAFSVALGPLKPRFGGRAVVGFEPNPHRGTIRGSGSDGLSRSRADGLIAFGLTDIDPSRSRLDLTITYRLHGPLAQFGRPSLVADVIDRLLAAFAANLAAVADGSAPTAAPMSGFRLALDLAKSGLRRLLSRGRA